MLGIFLGFQREIFSVVAMLKLETDRGEGTRDDPQYSSPKYIALTAINNVIGRGFQADIRLSYPWLSRKHLSVSMCWSSFDQIHLVQIIRA